MTKTNSILKSIASFLTFFFSAVLCISANTDASGMIYQPKAPAELKRFSRIK